MWLFASLSFADFVCVRSTCDSISWFVPQILEEFFPSRFPPSKEKAVVTINSCEIMTLFFDRSHFHQGKKLWSWHEKDLAEFTTLLLYINILPLLRSWHAPMLPSNKQTKWHTFPKTNFQVTYLPLSLQNIWGNLSVMAVGEQTLKG